jgi:excisionase family DNA binding protein
MFQPVRNTDVFDVAQAAAYAGVCEKTVRRAISAGLLRHAVLGKKRGTRIRREWIDEWIDNRSVGPPSSSLRSLRETAPARSGERPYAQSRKHQPRRGFLEI